MKAVVVQDGKAALIKDRSIPNLRDEFVCVRTTAVAINPTDWKHLDLHLVADGCLLGCDFAGTIVGVGKAVTKRWFKGDRVAGVAHGGNVVQPEDGALAEYVMAKGDILIKIPDSLSFEKAATLPLGVATVMQGLYQKGLKMNLPAKPIKGKSPVLIYGGSTATGALGIQSGYTVLTTCSPRNFQYVRSLGADHVFDYKGASVGFIIRAFTQNNLKLAWDTASDEKSARICAQALSSESTGCRYASFLNNKSPREDVESVGTNMYTVWGEYFKSGCLEYPASEEDFVWAKRCMKLTETLIVEGKLRSHKEAVKEDGLKGLLQGLDDLKHGKVSGEKLVYRVAETP